MAFVKLPGLQGKLYIPEKQNNCKKKHPCKDCYSCDYCSDDRCRLCRCNRDSESFEKFLDGNTYCKFHS